MVATAERAEHGAGGERAERGAGGEDAQHGAGGEGVTPGNTSETASSEKIDAFSVEDVREQCEDLYEDLHVLQ